MIYSQDNTKITISAPPMPFYLECGRRDYQAGDQHPKRQNLGMFDLIVVMSGTLPIGEEDKQWEVKGGQAVILLPDRYHYSVRPCTEATTFYWVHFQCSPSSELSPYTITLPQIWNIPDPEQVEGIFKRLIELAVAPRSLAFWQEQSLFMQLLQLMDEGQHREEHAPGYALAERTEAYLKQHYREELSNETLADVMHFHLNYITRCMKNYYGVTPMEYLLHYRLEQAKLLLLKTEWTVAAIAEYVGFQYPPYFTNCFKKRYDVSPIQYRKRYAR